VQGKCLVDVLTNGDSSVRSRSAEGNLIVMLLGEECSKVKVICAGDVVIS
jgi:hypothetical protein